MKKLFGAIIIGAAALTNPGIGDKPGNQQEREATVISSHYDKAGNLHEVIELENGVIRQFMYKPIGFVPLGTGDEGYK